jgi:hypothetical protein
VAETSSLNESFICCSTNKKMLLEIGDLVYRSSKSPTKVFYFNIEDLCDEDKEKVLRLNPDRSDSLVIRKTCIQRLENYLVVYLI